MNKEAHFKITRSEYMLPRKKSRKEEKEKKMEGRQIVKHQTQRIPDRNSILLSYTQQEIRKKITLKKIDK